MISIVFVLALLVIVHYNTIYLAYLRQPHPFEHLVIGYLDCSKRHADYFIGSGIQSG